MEHISIADVKTPASRIGLGTWAMGGVQWGGTDDDESVRTIHAALDLGVTLIDTAPHTDSDTLRRSSAGQSPSGAVVTGSSLLPSWA